MCLGNGEQHTSYTHVEFPHEYVNVFLQSGHDDEFEDENPEIKSQQIYKTTTSRASKIQGSKTYI